MTHKVHAVKKAVTPPVKINEKELQKVVIKTGYSSEFVKRMRKTEGLRTKQYKIAGVNTIGIGHNMDSDPKLRGKKGVVLSESQVYDILAKDLLDAQEKINRYTNNKFASLNQGQKEVVTDVSFSQKLTTFKSGYLVKAISEGRVEDAVLGINTVAAGGKVLAGLCIRSIGNIDIYARGMQPDKAKMAINNIIEKCGGRDDVMIAGAKAMDNLEMAWVFKDPPPQKPFTGLNR